ncbi:MAG: methyltransferase domain-containing protein [Pseudomonadota bacterium]|nr:methyltransferase domain-containing protein [Pseudomonadota bacterium]
MLDTEEKKLRLAFDAIANDYDRNDFYYKEIRTLLSERLPLINLQPKLILNLGAATGSSTKILREFYPMAKVIEVDWSMNMLKQKSATERIAICANTHFLPLTNNSIDIVFSNLLLPSCKDYEKIFTEIRRILRNPGLLLFSTLGPSTLNEIRKAWKSVDRHQHVHFFTDMHIIGDSLIKAGFVEPVMSVENITINYRNISLLINDLRSIAGTNRSAKKLIGLTTPRRWEKFISNLGQNLEGKIPISFEIIFGQAWQSPYTNNAYMVDGEAHFPLSDLIKNRG